MTGSAASNSASSCALVLQRAPRMAAVLPNEIAVRPTPVVSLSGGAVIGIARETGTNTILRFLPSVKP